MPLDPLYLATAIEAALAAGRIQRAAFRQDLPVEKKGPIDLVTAADLEVEHEFRRLIGSRFPSHQVLGEETAPVPDVPAAPFVWIIDPIDGTTNFVHGLALFCVSIALAIDGRVEVAAVYDPMGGELFTAERGEGARLNGARMAVSRRAALIDSLLCTGFPYSIQRERDRQVDVFAAFLGKARAVRRLGSAALDLCYLAAGRFDGFWEEHLHVWDIAAAVLIVQEAGGVVTDFVGAPADASGRQVIASNGAVHGPMLDAIREVRPGGELAG